VNVAFFLTPLKDVVALPFRSTVRQALERMEFHRYASVPLIDDGGHYVGTLTEGDLLWALKHRNLSFKESELVNIADIPRRMENRAVDVTTDIGELLARVTDQNFVPVVDSRNVLMGIVRRSAIIDYFAKRFKSA
jgi:CBS-domain-containing membrane protein